MVIRSYDIKPNKPIAETSVASSLQSGQLTLKRIAVIWMQQFILTLAILLIACWIKSSLDYSALIGGVIYLIPNMYFALYAFRYRGAHAARYVLLSFYRGEMGKFLLSGVGFAIAFTLVKPLDVLVLFGTYLALTVFQWIQLARTSRL
ncbi:ATP synthase subunit I [Eionea flava]